MQGDGNRAGETIGDSVTTVDELVELRDSVEEWVRKAADAVLCFRQDNGSFWKDTTAIRSAEGDDSPHITTTARAYIGLVYADRLEARKFARPKPKWSTYFGTFVGSPHIVCKQDGFAESHKERKRKKAGGKSTGTATKADHQDVNVFDAAHLADYLQVSDYLNRFYPETGPWNAGTMFESLEVSNATAGDGTSPSPEGSNATAGNGTCPASERIKE